MKKLFALLLCLVMSLGMFAGCNTRETPEESTAVVSHTLSVGYGRVDITPQEPVPLRGLGGDTSERMNKTVSDPLYATCIAFTDETGNTVLMYHLDLTNSFSEQMLYARSDISKATGVPMNQVMVTATHNHSSPDLANTKELSIQRYTEALKQWMVEAAEAALEDRKPAKAFVASTTWSDDGTACHESVREF